MRRHKSVLLCCKWTGSLTDIVLQKPSLSLVLYVLKQRIFSWHCCPPKLSWILEYRTINKGMYIMSRKSPPPQQLTTNTTSVFNSILIILNSRSQHPSTMTTRISIFNSSLHNINSDVKKVAYRRKTKHVICCQKRQKKTRQRWKIMQWRRGMMTLFGFCKQRDTGSVSI